ncbi:MULTISPECIES: glycine cleavage system protein GcvH [Thalassolituus]|jgi:glycine cleavage system H protein|uniref:Glycine cleavage system H protein n=1 Tax=Thalassolituus maritimus TaxID=484498 RepID=A0A1N7J0D2_9GAMM|nr:MULTISPECIES: glycine cleavage system protein GcvH [Thalassolituus]KZZ11736.1 glycine cleavage system protein H [Oleibacter sp. HI0075]MAX85451.1 glycine cleavage system protein H [Oceanospirillaceae bacterium]MEC8907334.1 glycine cleavage system protein GcvH [Pseudomonadota bacterium]OUX65583.1 MAG: glycine cleavage system protein H [Oceanospirillaceae bacterium TMED276]HCG80332.1 glycine cleavage system protein GcvH [Oceanospirillales bacterium]|tara:strand:+ start:120 stop:503 length:384 start_codon:yes stop_codon:yes gene_type:complete
MSNIPADLKYVASHEWIRLESDGTVTVGITDFAQDQLGDVVFVELPEVDSEVTADQDIAVVESVKAASDIYAPLAGKIIAVNDDLADAPEKVNEDPYGDAWFFKMELADAADLDKLLDADGYAAACE